VEQDKEQLAILKKMSGAERLKAAMLLNIEARKIKAAYLKMRHSDWSEDKINDEVKRIFLYART